MTERKKEALSNWVMQKVKELRLGVKSMSSIAPRDGVKTWLMTMESRENMRVDKTGQQLELRA